MLISLRTRSALKDRATINKVRARLGQAQMIEGEVESASFRMSKISCSHLVLSGQNVVVAVYVGEVEGAMDTVFHHLLQPEPRIQTPVDKDRLINQATAIHQLNEVRRIHRVKIMVRERMAGNAGRNVTTHLVLVVHIVDLDVGKRIDLLEEKTKAVAKGANGMIEMQEGLETTEGKKVETHQKVMDHQMEDPVQRKDGKDILEAVADDETIETKWILVMEVAVYGKGAE
jgi:hypothetical protein